LGHTPWTWVDESLTPATISPVGKGSNGEPSSSVREGGGSLQGSPEMEAPPASTIPARKFRDGGAATVDPNISTRRWAPGRWKIRGGGNEPPGGISPSSRQKGIGSREE
jgi:hypothetical protein